MVFSNQMPDLRALELLDAIGRTGSITLAAGELGVTQQAASLRLRRLEQSLGRSLVVRASRSSQLTGDGAALLGLAQGVLEAAAEMDAALETMLAAQDRLRVAASLTVAEYLLPQWLGDYIGNGNDPRSVRSRATNTREVVRLVADAEVDIGFVEGNEPPPGLRYTYVASDELAVLSEPALEFSSNISVLEAAAADVAPAVISRLPAAWYLEQGRLVRVHVRHVEFRRQFGAVWRQGQVPPTHSALELLRAALAG